MFSRTKVTVLAGALLAAMAVMPAAAQQGSTTGHLVWVGNPTQGQAGNAPGAGVQIGNGNLTPSTELSVCVKQLTGAPGTIQYQVTQGTSPRVGNTGAQTLSRATPRGGQYWLGVPGGAAYNGATYIYFNQTDGTPAHPATSANQTVQVDLFSGYHACP